jgi:hypothetical protein
MSKQRWMSLSDYLSGMHKSWGETKDEIREGFLRARGSCFGIDHQPLRPEWMLVAMWDDARDDTIFFREEKGADLVPPVRIPPHVTRIEVLVEDTARRSSHLKRLPAAAYPKQTKIVAARAFIAEKYPKGIPAGVTDKMIASQYGKEKQAQISERTIRRARK